MSDLIPRYWIVDNATLEGFVSNELTYGLQRAVEAKIVADINATSGIQTQAYSTSIPVSFRKAITLLEVSGYTPSAILVSPQDYESVELLIASTTAIQYQGLPFDAAARRLFGVPIVASIAETTGFGHVLAHGAVALDTDNQGVQLAWSETSNADSFSKNQIIARCEGRYATSVYRPAGVVKVATA